MHKLINFDAIGYRKYLLETRDYYKEKRDKYIYKNIMWNMYDFMVYSTQKLIDDMEDFAELEEIKGV